MRSGHLDGAFSSAFVDAVQCLHQGRCAGWAFQCVGLRVEEVEAVLMPMALASLLRAIAQPSLLDRVLVDGGCNRPHISTVWLSSLLMRMNGWGICR